MASESLTQVLRREVDDFPESLDSGSVNRILTQPQQDALAEAVAADAVDAVPLVGDLLVLSRMDKAEEMGVEYPKRPSALENAISDLPPPLDTVGDIVVSQNVLNYLETHSDVELPEAVETAAYGPSGAASDVIDSITPSASGTR